MLRLIFSLLLAANISCTGFTDEESKLSITKTDSVKDIAAVQHDSVIHTKKDVVISDKSSLPSLQTSMNDVPVDSIISFAKTLIGIPYLYASTDPAKGFDCSGFITYVYNHFNIKVPRSSIEFTNMGEEIALRESEKGDLILFTGTDSTERFVGHMGIIFSNENGDVQFIHSSSGKANGVVVTPLNTYYMGRFMKVVRISTTSSLLKASSF